jgi:hypothetical protein
VFASISHTFNLKRDKWAAEVSTALQSAFRVLALTRPEIPIITTMVLKSEGFKDYKALSQLVNESFMRVGDILKLADKDDTFSITVRDLKRIGKCCNSILQALVLKESKKQNQ